VHIIVDCCVMSRCIFCERVIPFAILILLMKLSCLCGGVFLISNNYYSTELRQNYDITDNIVHQYSSKHRNRVSAPFIALYKRS
jgi:hypothetical protein